jgi:collagenase-like PrtC family protease
MTENSQTSIREKADAAFRQAAATVIERARQHGTKIIVCENGQIVERTWQEMQKALKRKSIPPRQERRDSRS